jgi:PAS domain S-box-containing protein
MPVLPTLPRRSWLERSSLALAGALILIGALSIAGTWWQIGRLIQPLPDFSGIKINNAVAVLALGLALLGIELGWRRAPGIIALIPAAISAATLVEIVFLRDLGIDEWLRPDRLLIETGRPGRMSAMSAGCLLLVSGALVGRLARRDSKARLFAEAIVSSIAASAGFSTLLGYAAGLPAIYHWGTNTATAPVSAFALLLAGLALLLLAWRETTKAEGGPPTWAPLPAVVGCLTLTIILWIGLNGRERAYLGAKTQIAMDTLATTINFEFDRQASAIERLARMWSDLPENSEAVWEDDAQSQWQESSHRFGCVSISMVNPALRTIWAYPVLNNAGLIAFDHGVDPSRRRAIESARRRRGPTLSASTTLATRGEGAVIYSPVMRAGRLAGYVAGAYLYREFFTSLILDRKLNDDYRIDIQIGSATVYRSAAGSERLRNPDLTLDKVYPIFDRRIRLRFTPTEASLTHDRRFLPELALGAGFGLTLLLGLRVYLARNARSGQRAAEFSNAKLLAENEERRRIEARLKISDERLRLALDSTQIGIFEWSVASGHVYYSPGLWALLGYEHGRRTSTVEAWQSLIHPDDLPLYRARVESQLGGVATFIEPEYRVRACDGEWRWVYTRSKSVALGPDGKPTRIIGTVQDITARREAEQALRESQAEARKLSLVAAKTDNPVLIGSPDGTIEWINESFTRVMEYRLDEVVGRKPSDFMFGPESDPRIAAQIRAAVTGGLSLSTDVVNYSKSGRKYHLHLEIQPIRNEEDQLQNFIVIETDITARVETEQALRRAKAEADDASRAKSEFLASMSHEIRTPMNGVIGMTSLLMETSLTPEQRDFVNTIRTSGEALLTIINDILDFSKIESGKMDVERLPFDLATCLEESLDLFALQASNKKLELVYHLGPAVPPSIVGDVTRLRQVLVNLINNAVKFTPDGSIAIEVTRLDTPASSPGRFFLQFAVRDSGIGIPPERLDRLFKAFSQVDSSTTRKYGGTGLGLAISQHLTALMGGSIHVESTVGRGSTFVFTIETEAAGAATPRPATPGLERLAGGAVLCVEDHPSTQKRLRSLLEPLGASCMFARSATAARDLVATLPAPPVLLVIDGDETAGPSPLAELLDLKVPRLVMLPFGQTAPAAPADRQPFAAVSKPFKTAAFLHALSVLFNPSSLFVAANSAARPVASLLAREFPLDVLLAEDNIVNQKVALRFLDRLGYRADTVGNGREAVAALVARPYQLILMDLQMPEMDGLEASRQIRRMPGRQQPKIVALTANAMQGDRELCIAAGMDDYISKPVKLPELEATIRRLFGPATPSATKS